MEQPTLEQQRAYVQLWKENTKILEQIKKEELRAMTEEDRAATTVMLLDTLDIFPRKSRVSSTSGLAEQQRYFARLRP